MTRPLLTVEQFIEKALAVPFVEKGRGYDGWDCWGLICVAYWDVRGVFLPSNGDTYSTTHGAEGIRQLGEAVSGNMSAWSPVHGKRCPLDVALFRIAGRPVHVGLVVEQNLVLHAEEKVGTFVERLSSPMWARRLEGVYRHEALR